MIDFKNGSRKALLSIKHLSTRGQSRALNSIFQRAGEEYVKRNGIQLVQLHCENSVGKIM